MTVARGVISIPCTSSHANHNTSLFTASICHCCAVGQPYTCQQGFMCHHIMVQWIYFRDLGLVSKDKGFPKSNHQFPEDCDVHSLHSRSTTVLQVSGTALGKQVQPYGHGHTPAGNRAQESRKAPRATHTAAPDRGACRPPVSNARLFRVPAVPAAATALGRDRAFALRIHGAVLLPHVITHRHV